MTKMKPNEAIILAGGLGTRLKPVISDVPKPMAPIGDSPFLEYMLRYLAGYGVDHVVLSVGYRSEVVKKHFGKKFGNVKISYAVEQEPMGTGGGIVNALKFIKGEETFLLNGDTFFHINLNDLSDFYFAYQADLAMTVKLMRDFFRYGSVVLDVCKIKGFRDKEPLKAGYINGGVYIIRSDLFNGYEMPEKFSFEKDFLEKYVDRLKIYGLKSTDYFVDIGVPKDYEKARTELPGLLK